MLYREFENVSLSPSDDAYWATAISGSAIAWFAALIGLISGGCMDFKLVSGIAFIFAGLSELSVLANIMESDLCLDNAYTKFLIYKGQHVYGDCEMGASASFVFLGGFTFLIIGGFLSAFAILTGLCGCCPCGKDEREAEQNLAEPLVENENEAA